MENFSFNADAYLARIGFSGEVHVSLDSLRALHQAQINKLPFENFDICLGRGIDLNPESVFNKLVQHQRGGYCFELNGLMLMALQHYGFTARPLLGRVHLTGSPTGRSHQVTLVSLDSQQWIVDVGFGGAAILEPVRLTTESEQTIQGNLLRFVHDDLFGFMLQSKIDGHWRNLYSIDLNHVCHEDIVYSNHYTSTSPDSKFVSSRRAALPMTGGMVTLLNYTLKKRVNGKELITELIPGQGYLDALRENFGIVLNEPYEKLREPADE